MYRQPLQRGWIETGIPVFVGAVAMVMFFVLVAIAVVISFMFAALPSLAQPQVPPSCIVLAAREGFPLPETETQARIARAKLWFMSKRDPLVRDCRAAIRRYLAETKQ